MGAASRTLVCPQAYDVGLTFGPLIRGRHDPSSRIVGNELRHAMHTPVGASSFSLLADRSAATLTMRAWGPGRSWIIDHAGDIAGLNDRPCDFVPAAGRVAGLHRRLPGLRMIRLGTVYEVALATTVEQRVTTIEARRSWHSLVRRFGTPAPGNLALTLPPAPDVVATLPDWEWRRIGIEGRRSETMRRIARDASGLNRAVAAGDAVIAHRLRNLSGVGPWTTAHVMQISSGDADAVPIGDWHLPGHVGNALAGEARADDARMLELLEPFRPHRGRVCRLLLAGVRAPARRAPRARIHDLMRAEANRGRRRPFAPNAPRPGSRP